MSSFSPYIYKIPEFNKLETLTVENIDSYYNGFTFLTKPEKRNVYKISLAQMLNYMVDFGIGYGSVCETKVKTQQTFLYGRYVNRHNTTDENRPATIADLKDKIRPVIESMIYHTIRYNNSNNGVKATNTLYPTYLLTLDTELTSAKIKQLCGKDYTEVTDTKNFFYASSSSYTMPMYTDGLLPVTNGLYLCPEHNHSLDGESIWYEWSGTLKPKSKTLLIKNQCAGMAIICTQAGLAKNSSLPDQVAAVSSIPEDTVTEVQYSIPWEYPDGMMCYENEAIPPAGATTVNGNNVIPLRYHGRRYRLFKLSESSANNSSITVNTNSITVDSNG